jgi:hypothetical protein
MKKLSKLLVPMVLLPSVVFGYSYPTKMIGMVNNAVTQSTTSTVYTDFPSYPDQTTITVPSSGYVTVIYKANLIKGGCTGSLFDILLIDGNKQTGSEIQNSLNAAWAASASMLYTVYLNAGSHTFKVSHRTDSCSGVWSNRYMTIFLSAP